MTGDRSVSAATYSAEAHAMMGQRTAAQNADFFLPHLHPGMRLLDAGCGQGSITIGLADAVAPGEVVGLDRDPEQVDRARALAAERGVTNVRFEVADVYALPFPDASFDAVFAHQLLLWLREPVAVLKEFRRVLTDGGVVGVRTVDPTFCVMDPVVPPLDRLPGLLRDVWWRMGADWSAGHRQRRVLLDAGFARAENYATADVGGGPELERGFLLFERSLLQGDFRTAAVENNLAGEALLDILMTEFQAFCRRPDAFFTVLTCSALGWVKSKPPR